MEHPEAEQSLASFRQSRPAKPKPGQDLSLVSLFSPDKEQAERLNEAREFLQIFFQMPVRLLPPSPLRLPPTFKDKRPGPYEDQYLASELARLAALPQRPSGSFLLLAVTDKDLYANTETRFVYGQSFPNWGVGLVSIARLETHEGKSPVSGRDPESLRRWLRVLAHEAAHAFGLPHCGKWACLMNGANHEREMNATPLHLDPVCLLKLRHQRDFDILARYRQLSDFYRKVGLDAESAWTADRLRVLEDAMQRPATSPEIPLPF